MRGPTRSILNVLLLISLVAMAWASDFRLSLEHLELPLRPLVLPIVGKSIFNLGDISISRIVDVSLPISNQGGPIRVTIDRGCCESIVPHEMELEQNTSKTATISFMSGIIDGPQVVHISISGHDVELDYTAVAPLAPEAADVDVLTELRLGGSMPVVRGSRAKWSKLSVESNLPFVKFSCVPDLNGERWKLVVNADGLNVSGIIEGEVALAFDGVRMPAYPQAIRRVRIVLPRPGSLGALNFGLFSAKSPPTKTISLDGTSIVSSVEYLRENINDEVSVVSKINRNVVDISLKVAPGLNRGTFLGRTIVRGHLLLTVDETGTPIKYLIPVKGAVTFDE